MLRELKNLTSLIVFGFLLLNLSCGKDCPTCPEDPEPVPGSYYVYITDMSQSDPAYIWVINSKTDSIIDSIYTPDPRVSLIDISPDKRYLAALSADSSSVFIFDLEINEKIASLPVGRACFSSDGAYLLIGSIHLDRLFKISTLDWSIIDSDTMTFSPGRVFNNTPIIIGANTNREYVLYNYESMEIIKTDSVKLSSGLIPAFATIIASPQDEYLYFVCAPNWIFKLDMETDAVVDTFYFINGAHYGMLKNSPDGQYLIFTELSGWAAYQPIGNLVIINQNDLTLHHRITTYGLNTYILGEGLTPHLFDITPDGSKVICSSEEPGLPSVTFNLYELTASIIPGFSNQASIADVAIGRQIE